MMSDKPEETSWQSWVRKTKYQLSGRTKSQPNRYGDANWEAMMFDGLNDGFLGNYDEAIGVFDEVLQNTYERFEKKLRTDAYFAKANALDQLGRTDEALLTYDKAIELDPKQDNLYHNKGMVLTDLGRHSEALVCFTRAVELAKDYKKKIGGKVAKDSNYDKENEEYLEYRQQRHAVALSALAEAHLEMETTNDLNIALKLADEAIELDPNWAEGYRVKALMLSDALIEKYDEALENCEKGLEINPTDEDLLSLRALIYLNMEKFDLAEKHFLELLNHDPSQPDIHYNLACIYSLLKNKQKAIDHLLVATYLDPATTHSDMDEDESFDNIRDSEEFKRLQSVEV